MMVLFGVEVLGVDFRLEDILGKERVERMEIDGKKLPELFSFIG